MFAHIPRWLRIVVYLQCSLGIAIPLGGWLLQKQGESRDRQMYPPPGRLVDAAGTRLHIHCEGERGNGPVVVYNSDMGDHGLTWSAVLRQTAPLARSCYIDRPGFGWSEPGGDNRAITRMAEDLHAALTSAGEPAPYLLVGHGLGALHMVSLASRYPREIAGLLLVDPIPPVCLEQRFAAIVENVEGPDKEIIREKLADVTAERGPCPEGEGGTVLYSWLARIGMVRALAGENFDPTSPSPELLPVHRALKMRTAFADASLQESRTAYIGMAEARAALPALRGIPLEILSRGRMGNFPTDQEFLTRRADKPTLAFERAHLKAVQQAHAEMAEAAAGQVRVIEDAAHYIQLSQPQAVVDAVRRLLAQAPAQPSGNPVPPPNVPARLQNTPASSLQ